MIKIKQVFVGFIWLVNDSLGFGDFSAFEIYSFL